MQCATCGAGVNVCLCTYRANSPHPCARCISQPSALRHALLIVAGYLTREAGNALLQLLASRSAPGSRIIMTAPPTPAQRDRRNGTDSSEEPASAAAAGAGAAEGTNGGSWHADKNGVSLFKQKL